MSIARILFSRLRHQICHLIYILYIVKQYVLLYILSGQHY